MRFLLDESADYPLADFLRQLGHDVTAIAHEYPQALSDIDVLAIAFPERRILIANDRDFGELVFRHRHPHAGVILFRLGNETLERKQVWLLHVLTHYQQHLHQFLVVTDQRIRIRRTV
jgi:predicted nuclease of predicted toxin-antitoxin system